MSQALQQGSFRAISSTTGSYCEDALAAMATELLAADPPRAVPNNFNGRMIAWLQLRLDSTDTSLTGLMQAFAEANGAHNWSSLGSVDPIA